jgi:hypothetical protein
MSNLAQKNIDQYLDGKNLSDEQKEKVIISITKVVYSRNQNVIKAEGESDQAKKDQFLRSIEEYDQMIEEKIAEVLDGKVSETYDF